jgi:transcriptional regulator of nitric oxide reductase
MTTKRRKEEMGKTLYLLDYNKPIVVVEIPNQFIKAFFNSLMNVSVQSTYLV